MAILTAQFCPGQITFSKHNPSDCFSFNVKVVSPEASWSCSTNKAGFWGTIQETGYRRAPAQRDHGILLALRWGSSGTTAGRGDLGDGEQQGVDRVVVPQPCHTVTWPLLQDGRSIGGWMATLTAPLPVTVQLRHKKTQSNEMWSAL